MTALEKTAIFFNRIRKFVLVLAGNRYYREKLLKKFAREEKTQQTDTPKPDALDDLKRGELFQEFYREYFGKIIHSTYRETLSADSSTWDEYDYVIAGSDQIWNRGLIRSFEALRYYYLEFVAQDKRVNYAPSFGDFGMSSLKFPDRLEHRKGLNGFKKLSCREEEGCDLIRELTGRDAQLVLDPTFLLTAEQWRKIARKPEYEVPAHYALEYSFLAPSMVQPCAEKLAGGLPIVNAFDYRCGSQNYAMTGPREFLWLVDHADVVITSSFHGTAFSVIFGKRFVSLKAGSQFSRVKTILSGISLTDRIFAITDDPDSSNIVNVPVDYEAANEKLAALREKSMRYLADCLGR